jgi:histidine decarboxylase
VVDMTTRGRPVEELLSRVRGPFDDWCTGCPLSPGASYVAVPVLTSAVTQRGVGSLLLDEIVAFDKAEATEANLTQTNLIQVSSFCGPEGLLLGYDLMPRPLIPHPVYPQHYRSRSEAIPVYDLMPLCVASRELLGTVAKPHFPIRPGSLVPCAYKARYAVGPCVLYVAMAIGIPKDRSRNADLFMEDNGVWPATSADEERLALESVVSALASSVTRIGANLNVSYQAVFLGIRTQTVQVQEVGCVLSAAPYLHLARSAVELLTLA